ncbi:unnamed protein product [Closterium sp. Naga37s-1]|nr:unnamed protein product [Closterium sp. Naga37s-1]
MVHYLDVVGAWDAGECEWCFDRAVAPLLCVQAMLLEWLAEPRVGVLMDLGTIRSRLPAILAYTPAGAHCSAPAEAAHMDARAATFTALVTQLGARRHAQPDRFASMLVQVLGVKESADLQEGFGFFLQQLLPGAVDTGKVQAQGTGKKAAALGNAGPGSADEEDGREGDGDRQGPVGGGCEGGGDGQGGQWREHLKGREWERYVDGMAWILEHGGGGGREFRCSHCSEGGSSSSNSSGGEVVGSGSMEGRGIPRGMYVSGVGATDFALAVASVLSLPGHYEDQSLVPDGNNASKAKVENAALYEARNRLRKRVGERGRACGGSGARATGEAARRPNPVSNSGALDGSGATGIATRAASTSSSPCHLSSATTSASTTHALPPAAAATSTTFEAPQESTAAPHASAILAPGLVPVNTHPAMAVLTYRVACMLQWVRIYGSDFIPKRCCFRDSLQGKVLPMRHPLRDLPSLLLRFGAIPKPVEGSGFPLEWEEWPEGDDTAANFPHDPSARFFGLGIVEASGMEVEGEVVKEGGLAEEGRQGQAEITQKAAGKGKDGEGGGKRDKGGKGSGDKKAEGGVETMRGRGKGKGVDAHTSALSQPRPWVSIMRCRADVDFLLAFLAPMIKPPECSQCIKCLGTFMYHVPCCALMATFAYRPVDALFTRFLAAFPVHSPHFHHLFNALLLRSPLTVAEHIRLINEASPAGVRRGMSALRHGPEQMGELPGDPRMRERVMLLKARQMPLYLLLGVALYYAKPIMGVSHAHEAG